MSTQLEFVQKKVRDLASLIDAPRYLSTVFFSSPQNGKPHVEFHGSEFHYVTEERGTVFQVRKTNSLDTLMFWMFTSITSQMAWDFVSKNRISDHDPRRDVFSRQIWLISQISKDWGAILEDEIQEILAINPYRDGIVRQT